VGYFVRAVKGTGNWLNEVPHIIPLTGRSPRVSIYPKRVCLRYRPYNGEYFGCEIRDCTIATCAPSRSRGSHFSGKDRIQTFALPVAAFRNCRIAKCRAAADVLAGADQINLSRGNHPNISPSATYRIVALDAVRHGFGILRHKGRRNVLRFRLRRCLPPQIRALPPAGPRGSLTGNLECVIHSGFRAAFSSCDSSR